MQEWPIFLSGFSLNFLEIKLVIVFSFGIMCMLLHKGYNFYLAGPWQAPKSLNLAYLSSLVAEHGP